MSISLDQTHSSPDNSQVPGQATRDTTPRWLLFVFWGAIALLLVIAVLMRLYHLAQPFDHDSYDEGVYWQSLRSMLEGHGLYQSTFDSQPPFFLLSTYPGFALFGGTLWAARFGIALVSLLGFGGAYILGKTLVGRLGALAAILLLLVDPTYLYQSQTIQAEVSSVAFTLLAIGFAFLWWKQPDGKRGMWWAALCGITFVLSVMCKLLCVSTIVPIGLLMLTRIWQILRKAPGTSRQSWTPILVGVVAALLTTAALILPYAGSFQQFWASVVTFHEVAAQVTPHAFSANYRTIANYLYSLLALLAAYGTVTAFLRQDWRVLPMLAWLVATIYLLYRQFPLFHHHLIALDPPLIALALLGLADPASYKAILTKYTTLKSNSAGLVTALALLLLLGTVAMNARQDIRYYGNNDVYTASSPVQLNIRVANDLRQATAPGQWVVTDGQFVAALADRSTPPSLVDTSGVRIETGYVTVAQLEQAASDPRVHAVLFYTNRFYYMHQTASFHAWVAAHFHLLRTYGPGKELWVR